MTDTLSTAADHASAQPRTMRGVLLTGDRTAVLTDIDVPVPSSDEATVRVRMSAVCGSDLPHYRKPAAELANRAFTVPGHEAVGVVERAADDGSGPAVGTRVIIYQHSGEGECVHCRRGEPMFCLDRKTLGNHRHGANAEQVVVPASSLIPIPDELDDALATLVSCNFGTAFMGFRKTQASVGDRVVVVGLGPVGACVVASAVAAGATVIAIDPVEGRRDLALRLGAHTVIDPITADPVTVVRDLTAGEGAEIVVECSANPRAQAQAMKSVRVHGTVLLLGANNSMEIDPGLDVIRKELRLVGSWVFKSYEVDQVIRAALEMPALRHILSEPFPASRAPAAFAAADAGHVGKALVQWP
jgi:threonine dehydrogenase-like Zn-dependent dehydrogenase